MKYTERFNAYWHEIAFIARQAVSSTETLRLARDTWSFHLGNFLAHTIGREVKPGPPRPYRLRTGGREVEIQLRPNSGDFFIFFEVLAQESYYLPPSLLQHVHSVVDLGANIGLATIYLSRFIPDGRFVCIEPDPENVKLLRNNVRFLGGHVTVIEAAISGSDGAEAFVIGATWGGSLARTGSLQNRESRPRKVVRCFCLDSILEISGLDSIDLLKVDIEGGERDLFAGTPEWLSRVSTILIELHLPYSLEAFRRDLEPAGFEIIPPNSSYCNRMWMAVNRNRAAYEVPRR
jgi:FkbM family methyltransferase